MRYALAVLILLFLPSCQTTERAKECVNAEKVMLEVGEKTSATLFELDEQERVTFLSNLNNIPPITDHNWSHIYGLYSPKLPVIYIMAADANGCYVVSQEMRADDFRRLVTPLGSKTSV